MPLQEELSVGGINGDLWLYLAAIAAAVPIDPAPFSLPSTGPQTSKALPASMEKGILELQDQGDGRWGHTFSSLCLVSLSKGIKKSAGETETVSVHGNNLLKPPHGTSPSTCRTVQLVAHWPLRTQKVLYLETQVPLPEIKRPWGYVPRFA